MSIRQFVTNRFFILPLICAVATMASAQPREFQWRTDAALEQHLDNLIGLRWRNNPLRQALDNLSRNEAVAIFLDRRVDPGRLVGFETRDTPLRDVIPLLAKHLELGSSRVGNTFYIGPKETAAKLATLAAAKNDLARQQTAIGETWNRKADFAWPELSVPKSLVERCVKQTGAEVLNAGIIPHDLWHGFTLPAATPAEQLTILLAGFELTFEFDHQGNVHLIPLPAQVSLTRTYATRANPSQLARDLQRRFPAARVTTSSGRIVVSATAEEHRRIDNIVHGRPEKKPNIKPARGDVVFSLTIENQPVGGIAQALAKRLEREIQFDPRVSRQQLNKLVTFSVKDATMEELLKALLSPVDLSYELDSRTLLVIPK